MIESPDFIDPVHGIPVFSLYGEVRRPTRGDAGHASTCCSSTCRTSAAASTPSSRRCATCSRRRRAHGKAVWVLDRPNPVGRPVEGLRLRAGWESFVGAGPLPMRHGLTLGELGALVRAHAAPRRRVRGRRRWRAGSPTRAPGYGWPLGERTWVNPSPNAPNLSMARCYAGTVMLEGTTLSEGRGTTRPLELFGAPDLDARALLRDDGSARAAVAARLPAARRAGSSRPSTSTPAQLCAGRADPRRRPGLRSRRASARGASSRSRSRRCARCGPTTRCGATSPTSTSATGSRST